MNGFKKILILLFLITLLVIISNIQRLQENYANQETEIQQLINEANILDETNKKILNMTLTETENLFNQ
jgi:hypothetical protein